MKVWQDIPDTSTPIESDELNRIEKRLVNRYANIAARDAAIPAPEKGMATFQEDTSLLELHNGSLWKPVSGQLIAEVELAAAAATVTFSNIPQRFRHLLVVYAAKSSAASASDTIRMYANNDTVDTNYNFQTINADNATVSASRSNNASVASLPGSTGPNAASFGGGHILLPDYADASRRQTATKVGHFNNGNIRWESLVWEWLTSGAVNGLTFDLSTGDFVTDSVFGLWGL